jgi:glycyl-tRNA synthetase beta chain
MPGRSISGAGSQRSPSLGRSGDYAALLREVATIAPVMHQYFVDVFVLDKDMAIRENRLRLMRSIAERCARVAHLELLAPS